MRATSGRPYSANYVLGSGDREFVHLSETLDPEGPYWMDLAYDLKNAIEGRLGFEVFHQVADRVFPGEAIQQKTWKEIAEAWRRVLGLAQDGVADLDRLVSAGLGMPEDECGCVLPEQSCSVCRASARKVFGHAKD